MEADGSAGGVRNYLEVARVLQNRLGNLIAGTGDESPELRRILRIAAQDLKRVAVEEEECTTTCRHVCSKHRALMNPSLWGTLPHDVLELVFAYLPPPAISRLRCLSKHWKETLATVGSDFYRVCEEVCPKMFALITRDRYNLFWVRVFNTKSNRWYTGKIAVGCSAADWTGRGGKWDPAKKWLPNMMPHMTAVCAGGGLVCFVTSLYLHSKKKKTRPSLYINVVNPLTGRSHELPPLLELCDMRMMQIKVDRCRKCYKVVVLGKRVGDSTFVAEVYHSATQEWAKAVEPSEDLFLFRKCHLEGRFEFSTLSCFGSACAYDFGRGELIELGGVAYRRSYALYKDRMFVLRIDSDGPANESTVNQSPMYYIEEFQVQMQATTWVKVKVGAHRCDPFEHPPKAAVYSFKLYACDGFLMVFTSLCSFGNQGRFVKELGWLYELSTGNWCDLDLPQLPVGRRTYVDSSSFRVVLPGGQTLTTNCDSTYDVVLMCDVHWDA